MPTGPVPDRGLGWTGSGPGLSFLKTGTESGQGPVSEPGQNRLGLFFFYIFF